MSRQEPVAITGIMLRGDGKDIVVEAEVDARTSWSRQVFATRRHHDWPQGRRR